MTTNLSNKFGLPPGSLVYVGKKNELAECHFVSFDQNQYQTRTTTQFNKSIEYVDPDQMTWLSFQGLPNSQEIEALGKKFNLHPLLLEDILNQQHPPKIEINDDVIFVIIRYFKHSDETVIAENVSLILGPNYLLTFHTNQEDLFKLIRLRIQSKGNRIQDIGISYLYFALIDYLFDHHYLFLDWLNDQILLIDTEIFEKFDSNLIHDIHQYKKLVFQLIKAIHPSKEIAYQLYHDESSLISERNEPYLRDLIEHANQVVVELNGHKEALFNLQAQYLALSGQRMNEIMKFLTMMGSIFIPLTFLAGIYGMNFRNMPELEWKWGYFGALGLMFLVGVGIWLYFKSRKWL
ncbi:MAG: magnesium/cobalt transporter CorA [Deltaproteobacteria bacterium]|nr:magnesium/cobalt transporter CorA [Deltaproteobacteria bacterium]